MNSNNFHDQQLWKMPIDFFQAQIEERGPLTSIGIASFGPVDPDPNSPTFGHITSTPKPHWANTDLVGPIKQAFNIPVGFDTDVNGLPLSFIIPWYEQKAVAVLVSLLHLGIKDVHLGPSLPAFVTPNVLDVLVKNYNLTPIGTPEGDLKKILA